MKLRNLLLVIAILVHTSCLDTQQADAQGPTTVVLENVAALVSFGERITFVATVKSPLPVQDASIVILDESRRFDGCRAGYRAGRRPHGIPI